MAQHYFHLSNFTSGPGEDPVQGPGDGEGGLHGPGDLGQGHPVAVALDDVAIAAKAVADAALSVAEAPPDALDVVDGAGVEPPTDDVGDTNAAAGAVEHVYADIVYAPVGDNVPGLHYEEIRLSDDDNKADVTDGDGDSLLVNRSVPELVNGVHDDDHDSNPGPEQPQDVPLNVLHDAPAGSDQEANHTPEPPAEL